MAVFYQATCSTFMQMIMFSFELKTFPEVSNQVSIEVVARGAGGAVLDCIMLKCIFKILSLPRVRKLGGQKIRHSSV